MTVRDIARVVGVSASTVSRALRQPGMVSSDRRRLILEAAESMGYRPNMAARELTTGETKIFGLIVPDLDNPLFASLVKGAQARARSWGYSVVVADSEEDAHLEAEILDDLERRVDGVMLFSPRISSSELRDHAARIPVVLVNREVDQLPSISIDEQDSMRQALLHLVSLGHTRIAHVSGPAESWADRSRSDGLRLALVGLDPTPSVQISELGRVTPSFSGGVAAADWVLADGATAVVCYNDLIALGVLARAVERGVDVPSQLSIVGYDGIAAGTVVTPSLTTMSVPSQRMGRDAVDLLIRTRQNPGSAEHIHLEAHLTVRRSSDVADPTELAGAIRRSRRR